MAIGSYVTANERLLAVTVTADKGLLAVTVTANKGLLAVTVTASKRLLAVTIRVKKNTNLGWKIMYSDYFSEWMHDLGIFAFYSKDIHEATKSYKLRKFWCFEIYLQL